MSEIDRLFDELLERLNKRIVQAVQEGIAGLEGAIDDNTDILRQFLATSGAGDAVSATLIFVDEKGEILMPATIAVGGKGAIAVYAEFDGPNGTGNRLPAAGPVTFTSNNPAAATVDASGNVTAVAAGTSIITGADATNGLSASDTVTVTAAVVTAQSATMTIVAN